MRSGFASGGGEPYCDRTFFALLEHICETDRRRTLSFCKYRGLCHPWRGRLARVYARGRSGRIGRLGGSLGGEGSRSHPCVGSRMGVALARRWPWSTGQDRGEQLFKLFGSRRRTYDGVLNPASLSS